MEVGVGEDVKVGAIVAGTPLVSVDIGVMEMVGMDVINTSGGLLKIFFWQPAKTISPITVNPKTIHQKNFLCFMNLILNGSIKWLKTF